MRLRVTNKVDNHHTNQNYQCLIVDFLKTDDNIRKRDGEVVFDWLPRDQELFDIISYLFRISPTFRTHLCKELNVVFADKLETWY